MADDIFRHKLTPNLTSVKFLDRRISPFLSSDRPIWSSSSAASSFLDSVDELISLIHSHSLPPATDLLHLSMLRLQQEFNALINENAEKDKNDENDENDDYVIPIASPIIDYNLVVDALSSGTISDLNAIAKRMSSSGYSTECCHVYSLSRRDFLEESLSRLGLMTWHDDLEEYEILRWRKAAFVAFRILFPSERRLSDRVFFGLPEFADVAFAESCRGPAARVLGFAVAGSRAPDRLFKFLDIYETVLELAPEIDLFCGFLNEAVTVLGRLGEAIRGVFMELENLIRRDPAKVADPGGGIHPITRYVCNYLRAACRSRKTLERVFEEGSLSVQMGWIMELLESNLVAKAKVFGDLGLFSVFMMNNGKYIVEKVRDDELGFLLGDDWIRKHEAKVRQYCLNYQRSSWNKVLMWLKLESGDLASMREKIKAFYAYFDEICKTQSTWVVSDELKEELKKSILGNLLPPYMTFLSRFQAFSDIGKNDRRIKYSVEDIEARINELFRGSIASPSGKK